MGAAETRAQTRTSKECLDSVLRLQPRVAAFVCDGSLWAGDAGERFFDWELKQGEIIGDALGQSLHARYAEYKGGKVSEDTRCGEMVTMHEGVSELLMMRAAVRFFDEFFVSHILPELRELVKRLQEHGSEGWAVKSSNEWVIRAGMKHFGIPENHILAAKAELDEGIVTNRLIRVPSGPDKPKALRECIKKEIDAAFGNSRWDTHMLEMATRAFAINPNSDLEAVARSRGWPVYFPGGTRGRA